MEVENDKKTMRLLLAGVAIVFVAIIFGKIIATKNNTHNKPDTEQNDQDTKDLPSAEEMITVTSPMSDTRVDASNGITLSGEAVGGWFFEASAPVAVYGKSGALLAQSNINAEGDWMTSDFVSFTGLIEPFITNGEGEGYIEFKNDNPSDNEGFRRSLRVNIVFTSQVTQRVVLYFANSKLNPNTIDCNKVFPVTRIIPRSKAIATGTLSNLLMGPTSEEIANGYSSVVTKSNVALKSLNIKNNVAIADFSLLPSGGSCAVGTARAQIEQTLKQFPTIKAVKIMLNGSTATALQP